MPENFNIAWISTLLALSLSIVTAQTIDFETLPDGTTPTEGLIISNQYAVPYGVRFQFEDGSYPRIAKVGPPGTAFSGPNGSDMPATNQNVGSFFMTDDGFIGIPPPPLIMTYSSPVSASGGVILDIESSTDGPEGWRIEARGVNSQVLDSRTLTPVSPNAGDGLATPWSFSFTTNTIYSIRISYIGQRQNYVGFAFDNFTPITPNPAGEPGLSIYNFDGKSVPRLAITGTLSAFYRIDYSDTLPMTLPTNWNSLTNFLLLESPYVFFDETATNSTRRYYRAVGLPSFP